MGVSGLWGLDQSVSGVSLGSGIRMRWTAGIFLYEAGVGACVAPFQVVLPLPSGQALKLPTRVSGQGGGPQGAAGSSWRFLHVTEQGGGGAKRDCHTGATQKASWRGCLWQQWPVS